MMNWRNLVGSLLLGLGIASAGLGFDGGTGITGWLVCAANCVGRLDCVDYCPKRLPAVPCIDAGCRDDYSPKPVPCAPQYDHCYGCDDYCPKPVPKLHCPALPCQTSGPVSRQARTIWSLFSNDRRP